MKPGEVCIWMWEGGVSGDMPLSEIRVVDEFFRVRLKESGNLDAFAAIRGLWDGSEWFDWVWVNRPTTMFYGE